MSRLAKARTFASVPAVPGVPSRPAEVQCPPPPAGRAYVIRNGGYVLAAINAAPPPPAGSPPTGCYILETGGRRYLVCGSPFPTVTLLGG